MLAAARNFVQGQFDALAAEGYGTDGSGNFDEGNFGPGNVVWEDWHITDLTGPYYETAGDIRVEIWNVSYETYTSTPERVVPAGGSYVGEDGWCMIGYPGCDYLYFRLDEDGNRTFLYSAMENDCAPGTVAFQTHMVRVLVNQGLLKPADLDGLYTLEDFEKDLVQRREDVQKMVSDGNMTQADYDEWDQRQEEILAGLRNGTLEGRIADGTIYFDPAVSN